MKMLTSDSRGDGEARQEVCNRNLYEKRGCPSPQSLLYRVEVDRHHTIGYSPEKEENFS